MSDDFDIFDTPIGRWPKNTQENKMEESEVLRVAMRLLKAAHGIQSEINAMTCSDEIGEDQQIELAEAIRDAQRVGLKL